MFSTESAEAHAKQMEHARRYAESHATSRALTPFERLGLQTEFLEAAADTFAKIAVAIDGPFAMPDSPAEGYDASLTGQLRTVAASPAGGYDASLTGQLRTVVARMEAAIARLNAAARHITAALPPDRSDAANPAPTAHADERGGYVRAPAGGLYRG